MDHTTTENFGRNQMTLSDDELARIAGGFFAYGTSFTGGIFVAGVDVNGVPTGNREPLSVSSYSVSG